MGCSVLLCILCLGLLLEERHGIPRHLPISTHTCDLCDWILFQVERGAPLRALLPKVPLDRMMLETDAPWMGFVKSRRTSEPSDVVLVAKKVVLANPS